MPEPGRTGPLRVALLGCGTVGAEVVRLLVGSADDLAARIGAPLELVGIAVRRAGRARDLPVDDALFTTDAAGLVARDDVDLVVEVIGGIEPARTLLLSRAARRQGRRDGQQGAARRGRREPARRGRRGRRRPLLRGERRRRDPAAAAAARVAGRRRRPPGHGHRQRHHQLRPDPHGRDRRGLRRGARRGHRAGLRRGRPDRRRRGLRRRRQGGDPRLAGLPHPRHGRRRPPRGHHRRDRGRRRERPRDGLRRQAARDRRAGRRRASACACTRR